MPALLSGDAALTMRVILGIKERRRRQWHPTPVLLPGEPHGRRSLAGYSPRGRKESDPTERFHFHFSLKPSLSLHVFYEIH